MGKSDTNTFLLLITSFFVFLAVVGVHTVYHENLHEQNCLHYSGNVTEKVYFDFSTGGAYVECDTSSMSYDARLANEHHNRLIDLKGYYFLVYAVSAFAFVVLALIVWRLKK